MENTVNIDEILAQGVRKTGFTSIGSTKYGWNRKSAGCKVKDEKGTTYWLKVQYRSSELSLDKLWFGEVDALNFTGIRKPKLISSIEWTTDTLACRGDMLQYISFTVCSRTPQLTQSLPLNNRWFENIKTSLDKLGEINTDRINTRQDLITRRIKQRFGDTVETTINSWTTVHGDLHWANLTKEECWIFDWEAWGIGPVGLDAAFLYCFTLLQPKLAKKIHQLFNQELTSKEGIISQLFVCSELLRMIELHNDHPELGEPLKELASKLIHNY